MDTTTSSLVLLDEASQDIATRVKLSEGDEGRGTSTITKGTGKS